VDHIFETISEALEKGEDVKISGFGNFKVRQKHARKGRNPKTGEQIEISGRRVVKFRASNKLRKKWGNPIGSLSDSGTQPRVSDAVKHGL
jgi:integration host factor subunit alpha